MNPEYRITFRRYRVLLLLPIILAPLIALWAVIGAAPEYRSTASIWFDTPPPADSSVTHPDASLTPPSAQAQTLLDELLQTKQFRSRVGERSSLTPYLLAHPNEGWDPLALIRRVRGAATIDDELKVALGSGRVSATTDGPQILSIAVREPTPAFAVSTLWGVIDQFRQEKQDLAASRARTAAAYYRDQVAAARQADDAVRSQITEYLRAHPGSNLVDPNLAILTQAEQTASARLLDATNNLNVAAIGETSSGADQAAMEVIDKPASPRGPVIGPKALAIGMVAGEFGGFVVAIAGLISLVGLRRLKARAAAVDTDAELELLLGDAETRRVRNRVADAPFDADRS